MFGLPLARRVERFWSWFVENEGRLSGMLHPQTPEEAEAVTAFVQEGTGLISENLNFNIGGDCEFTFSAEGWPDLFILYPYIVSRMPQSLKGKWKFYPFNQGEDRPFGFRMFGADIDTGRIMALPVREGGQGFTVSYYEENLCALPKEESDEAMWVMLENTLERVLRPTMSKTWSE